MQKIPAVVINLKARPDRLSWFMNNANAANLEVEHIKAVDASQKDALELIYKHKKDNCQLVNAELACILSHRIAWRKLLNSENSHIAIFEDDVLLSKDIGKFLSQDINANDLHLIKLETTLCKVTISNRKPKYLGERHLNLLLSKHDGSAGYIVSRQCASRLLELTEYCTVPVDVLLFGEHSVIKKEFNVYQVSPGLCVQEFFYSKKFNTSANFKSDIKPYRELKRNKSYLFMKFIRRIFRYIKFVYKGADPFCYRKVIEYN